MSNNLFELPDNISVDTIVKDRIGKVELSLEIDDALLLLRFLDSTTEFENTRCLTTHIHEEIVNCLNNKNVFINKYIMNHIYNFGILDFWTGWTPLFSKDTLLGEKTLKPLNIEEFNHLSTFIAKLGKLQAWDEVRNLEEYHYNVIEVHQVGNNTGEMVVLFGIKFDNDGMTYVGSTHELTPEQINEICINDIWSDSSHVKCIYKETIPV